MRFKLHMWAFPGLGELTHPEWMGARTEVEAEDAKHAVEIFSRDGWSGMCSLEDERGALTHHRLVHTETGAWTEIVRQAYLAKRAQQT